LAFTFSFARAARAAARAAPSGCMSGAAAAPRARGPPAEREAPSRPQNSGSIHHFDAAATTEHRLMYHDERSCGSRFGWCAAGE